MRNLLFENIWILSRKDQAAREIEFHPKKTLFVGRNHTGKSSLIKAIFETVGAPPSGKLDKWDHGATSLLKLSIDGTSYHILRQGNHRALLDADKKQLRIASSWRDWSQIFASLLDFNLTVFNKGANQQSSGVLADTRCFFLPFYINQDGSWQGKWDTFQRMEQYSNPVPAILEYFTGVKPPEYYKLNAERKRIANELDEHVKEQKLLKKAWERFGKKMAQNGPKLNQHNFEAEVDMLTIEVTELNQQQEKIRERIVKERELIFTIQHQVTLANTALATYDHDNTFLQENKDALVCPTCGAEHGRPFIDILKYAEDARVLREFVGQLQDDLVRARKRTSEAESTLSSIVSNYRKVSDLLATRRGTLKLQEVLSGMGAEEAFSAFKAEFESFKEEINRRAGEIATLESRLKALTSRTRSKEILETFRTSYSTAMRGLNLPPSNTSKLKLTSRPALSGSGGPRQTLAYYSAIWTAAFGSYGSFTVPIVIDSPNQQGQDEINLPAILEFISKSLPQSAQVIVGSEIPTPQTFDKVYELAGDSRYAVLQRSQFPAVEAIIEPLEHSLFLEIRKTLD